MSKIETDLPVVMLDATAKACGFRVAFDRTPGADEWTLSAGHGGTHVQYIGTKASVCAFLNGYAAMQLQTTQILNDLDRAQQELLLKMRARFASLSDH